MSLEIEVINSWKIYKDLFGLYTQNETKSNESGNNLCFSQVLNCAREIYNI